MKVAGFTFIRNAIKYDYPVTEAIRSILPVCDEVIVNVGNSDDNTEGLIRSIDSPKIKIHHSVWDESLREGGRVLAEETNKAFDLIDEEVDWCFYIQADEVVHEQYHGAIRQAMAKYLHDPMVEGLLFRYVHFYGSYDYVGDSRKWYSHEIRVIRNDKSIRSWRDAQGFRIDGRKLRVKEIAACIYHYGWVKHPSAQLEKINNFQKLWVGDAATHIPVVNNVNFDYSHIDSLTRFKGTHPAVMQDRIARKNWTFDHDISRKKFRFKDRVLHWLEKLTGHRFFDYRNYRKL